MVFKARQNPYGLIGILSKFLIYFYIFIFKRNTPQLAAQVRRRPFTGADDVDKCS
jgi:hypothetical protein